LDTVGNILVNSNSLNQIRVIETPPCKLGRVRNISKLGTCSGNQWCSRDSNLRNLDRDLVKTSRPRLHQKFRDRDLKFDAETPGFKICAFCRNFFKMSSSLVSYNFFKFLALFRPILVVSYLKIQKTKHHWKYSSFTKPFLCNIQSLETCSLRDRDETWNLRDRDSQKWSRNESRERDQVSRLHHWWQLPFQLSLNFLNIKLLVL